MAAEKTTTRKGKWAGKEHFMLVSVITIVAILYVFSHNVRGGVYLSSLVFAIASLLFQTIYVTSCSEFCPSDSVTNNHTETFQERSTKSVAKDGGDRKHNDNAISQKYVQGGEDFRSTVVYRRRADSENETLERNRLSGQGGVTFFATSFDNASYDPDHGGKLWKNLISVPTPTSPSLSVVEEKRAKAIDRRGDLDLHFRRTPDFTREDGFSLGTNSISGPNSFQMGIRGDMAFTVFLMFQFAEDIDHPVSMFKFYANTPGMNGVSMTAITTRSSKKLGKNDRILRMKVTLGDGVDIMCTFPPTPSTEKLRHAWKGGENDGFVITLGCKYVVAVVKNFGKLQVYLKSVEPKNYSRNGEEYEDEDEDEEEVGEIEGDARHIVPGKRSLAKIADANVKSVSDLSFSNKDMTINETANWPGTINVFGCFSRALSIKEISTFSQHYSVVLKRYDPVAIRSEEKKQEMTKLFSCPFDEPTCTSCSEVDNWIDFQNLITSSDHCKQAIHRFCSDNPTHSKCRCWNVNDPVYNKSCRVFRCMMNPASCKSGGSQVRWNPTAENFMEEEESGEGQSSTPHSFPNPSGVNGEYPKKLGKNSENGHNNSDRGHRGLASKSMMSARERRLARVKKILEMNEESRKPKK
jgi:hypothetical protein